MSRRRLTEIDPSLLPADPPSHTRLRAKMMTLGEFAAKPIRQKKLYGEEKWRAEMEAYAESGEWEGATGGHLVALYDKFHSTVYGVASDLDRKGWMYATSAADRMVLRDFEASPANAVRFMRWLWKEEARREEWRRENHRDGRRIGWRLQFCFGTLIADYRVHVARQGRIPNTD